MASDALASSALPARIVRIDLGSGRRVPWCGISPIDPAGVFIVDRVHISADGTAYVYTNRRMISSLSILDGLD